MLKDYNYRKKLYDSILENNGDISKKNITFKDNQINFLKELTCVFLIGLNSNISLKRKKELVLEKVINNSKVY